ncbi:Hypothetical protein CINCED_3A016859 [Cinara cedri]|uniref:Neurotransmitter-gated ion-channel ligand-binding domain-containing protein n=1 Tax=Cinara cedri TaxID=506608 RepID=A0A5E4M1V0_9HEMI|nr:Hypothetical protein CINCED_3A016859 [Cinara cedri]
MKVSAATSDDDARRLADFTNNLLNVNNYCAFYYITPTLTYRFQFLTDCAAACHRMERIWRLLQAASFLVPLLQSVLSDSSDVFENGKSDKEILDNLVNQNRYDKRLLPPVDDQDFCCGMKTPQDLRVILPSANKHPIRKGPLLVNVSVLLLSLASPDESSLKYEVEFLLQQQWYDPRLRYSNQSRYDFLNAIHHHGDIWLPDTYFIMHGDFKASLIPVHFSLRIYRNGSVHYLMRRHLILSCQGILNIFPFDDPQCTFSMESISYEMSAIKYVWKNDESTLKKSPSLKTLNAYLDRNHTTECPSTGSWRGVTTMLNFFTTSNGFRSTLPVVSNLTAMNVWDGVCMCCIYASLLEFVLVNYVGRKRSDWPMPIVYKDRDYQQIAQIQHRHLNRQDANQISYESYVDNEKCSIYVRFLGIKYTRNIFIAIVLHPVN